MGNDSPRFCQGNQHVSKEKFECMFDHCSIKPYLCRTCAERSDVDRDKFICKLCKITEEMNNFDSSTLEID